MKKTKKKPVSGGVAKVPVIMQMEALECGAASLAMVLAYYQKWIPLEQVRLDCGVSRDGSNMKNVYLAAKNYGLDVHGYQMEVDVLKKQGIPYEQTTDLEAAIPQLDILYMTRVQRERFFNEEDYLRLKDSYILTPDKLRNARADMSILHPLPRVNEISVAIDEDPRACYFKQVLNGKYMRMALILMLLKEAGTL